MEAKDCNLQLAYVDILAEWRGRGVNSIKNLPFTPFNLNFGNKFFFVQNCVTNVKF